MSEIEKEEGEVSSESASPLPVEKVEVDSRRVPIQITFGRAIDMILDGHKMTRLAWDDSSVYIYLGVDGNLSLYQNKVHQLIVCEGDMRAEDWVVVQ